MAAKQTKNFAVYDLIGDEKTRKEAIEQLKFGNLSAGEISGFVGDIFKTDDDLQKSKISSINIAINNANRDDLKRIFAIFAALDERKEFNYELIQDKKLKNQALTYRDGLYVKPYVVSAVIVPLAGFGTVGFGIYLNFAKSVPNILNSMANGVKNANPIVSVLVAVAVPAASLVVSYFFGKKAKQNSKTNRDNKNNIDGIRRELDQNQENIK